MFLLLLRKKRNSLGISYRAGLRARLSITVNVKHKHTSNNTSFQKENIKHPI